jgi:phosphoribosyl 1,2-cyclic phosphate phosphodiesterase
MRASLYVKGDAGERLVIDTGPEFRLQALRAGISRLDAVLLTHPHADHVHGLDDVRPLTWASPLPVYGNQPTIEELEARFAYVFQQTQKGGGKPRITPEVVPPVLNIGRLSVTPVPVKHGILDILGWKITENGSAAVYLTDTNGIPAPSRSLIAESEILIIGALRVQPHETHFSFDEAMEAAADIHARRVYFTHLSHDYKHREIEDYCRQFQEKRGIKGIFMGPSYDGLELSL